jgi:hypothetical protein
MNQFRLEYIYTWKVTRKLLCSYPKQAKMSFYFFYIIGDRRAELVLPGRIGTNKKGEKVGKGCGKVNIIQKLVYIYVNGKMVPVETIPGMGVEG